MTEDTGKNRAVRDRKPRVHEPLEVTLHVSVRFGDGEKDVVTVLNRKKVPMVGTLFEQRDVLVRGLFKVMMRAALATPGVIRRKRR